MNWIIKNKEGIVLLKPNKQFLVFKHAEEALRHIEDKCGNSPYLKPARLYKKPKII